jgi:hypothetical protein
MSEVRKVTIQIAPPKGKFPGAVTYGFYTVVDGVVTMTDKDGNPAGLETGRSFSHKLKAGEDAHLWACKMTCDLRKEFKGSNSAPDGFSGPIHYPRGSVPH